MAKESESTMMHYFHILEDMPYEVEWFEDGKKMSQGERSYRAAEMRARQKNATIRFKRKSRG